MKAEEAEDHSSLEHADHEVEEEVKVPALDSNINTNTNVPNLTNVEEINVNDDEEHKEPMKQKHDTEVVDVSLNNESSTIDDTMKIKRDTKYY